MQLLMSQLPKNNRFERNPYAGHDRAVRANSNQISAWWNSAVRETLAKNSGKNLTNSDRLKNNGFETEKTNDRNTQTKGE